MGALTMEIEKLNNSFVSEKNKKRQERQDKQILQEKLFNYFYNQFKIKEEDFENKYIELNYIKERERILNLFSTSTLSFQYLNTIYNKTLKEVYQIFKTNYVFIAEQDQKFEEEKKEKVQKVLDNLQIVLNQKIEQQKQEEHEKILEQIEEKKEKETIKNILSIVATIAILIFIILKSTLIFTIGAGVLIFIFICACAKGK